MLRDRFDGIEAFLAVAARRSFAAAARDLGVTGPAVSQAVRQLERRVGVPLFYRTTRSVNLTEAGRQLLDRAQPAATAVAAALADLRELGERPSGLLRLNVPRLAVPLLIEPVLPGFLAAFPDVTVEVSVDDGIANVVDAGFDAGIRLGSMIERDLVAVPLTPPLTTVVVGAPGYLAARGRPQSLEDLAAHDCIAYRRITAGTIYRWEFVRDGVEVEVAVTGRVVVNDTDLTLRAALDGLGLAYLFDVMTAPYEAAGRLERVLQPYALVEPGLFLYYPARSQVMAKLRAFIDYVRERRNGAR